MASPKKIKVLVVDDSALVRRMITTALAADPEIDVVGSAVDPYDARDKIKTLSPDVLTLDIDMPRMDGLTFLKILQQQRPMPVIMVSSLTQEGSAAALEALENGAFEVLAKPTHGFGIGTLGPQLIACVKAAALAPPRARAPATPTAATAPATTSLPTPARTKTGNTHNPFGLSTPASPAASATAPLSATAAVAATLGLKPVPPSAVPSTRGLNAWHPRQLILIGSSTGGVEALAEIFPRLPASLPGIAIVQHIPPYFSKMFAQRLNDKSGLTVREAAEGDVLKPGLALVAPGDFHMTLAWVGGAYRVSLNQKPAVHHCRPAVDVLFNSVAEIPGARVVAAILTGMGNDGALGMQALKKQGAKTIAQDEASSVVYGMPRMAAELGVVDQVVTLKQIARVLTETAEAAVNR